MIKVMLIDDEPFIRQGMHQMICWEDYGYSVVAEAGNGVEAIEKLKKVKVDLIFVDLKMPGMTGLELIELIQTKIDENIKFVILTGYADFDYAQKAISLKVKNYMLKPIHEEELKKVLEMMNREYHNNKKEEREKYDFHVERLLIGKYSQEDLACVKKFLLSEGEDIGKQGWKYISFEFSQSEEKFKEMSRYDKMSEEKKLSEYLQGLLKNDSYHVVPIIDADEEIFGTGLLLQEKLYKKEMQEETEYITNLQKRVNQYLDHMIQVYVGQKIEDLKEISQSYQSIRLARCLHGIAESKMSVMRYEDYEKRKPQIFLDEKEVRELLKAVKENNTEEIIDISNSIFQKIKESSMTIEMVNASVYHILYQMMEMAKEIDGETNQQDILQYIGQESFDKLILRGTTGEWNRFFLDYAGYLAQVRTRASKGILDHVEEYVLEHYKENISLKFLGEYFFINNVYLGQLFKKKFGVSFKDYLTELRINKAKELLLQSNLRIYAIAEEVGFGNVDYFINRFVQLNGITPNQYRMKNR